MDTHARQTILRRTNPENLVIWSGAGLSADAPTNGPLGKKLTDRALEHYFAKETAETLAKLYSDLNVPNAQFRPRLETVLDALAEALGLDFLYDVLSDLSHIPPNRHHIRVAELQHAGTKLITANFDTCIQRALSPAATVIHFHGLLHPDVPIDSLGARLRIIDRGFTPEMTARLTEALDDANNGPILFIGYSGSDFFDATPFLLDYLSTSNKRTVLWHQYSASGFSIKEASSETTNPIIASAIGSGHEVLIIKGTLDQLFEILCTESLQPHSPISESQTSTVWQPRLYPTDTQRLRASALLYGRIGYRKRTLELYNTLTPSSPVEHDLLADAYWGAGKYRYALQHWLRSIPGNDRNAWALKAERIAAYYWITGRLIRAERLLRRTIDHCTTDPTSVSMDCLAKLFTTYGRVITHMRRSPDTTIVLPRKSVKRIARLSNEFLATNRQSLTQTVGIELANASAAIAERKDHTLTQSVSTFEEREALSAWLSYCHAALRVRAGSQILSTRPTELEYRQHANRVLRTGSYGDYMRSMDIPGAAQYFSIREFLQTMTKVEMSTWHRLRIFLHFAMNHFVLRSLLRK